MSSVAAPALAGGQPVRSAPLPYGRHELDEEDVDAVVRVLRSQTLTGGAEVQRFEQALAERCGVAHAVAVSSGTAALHLALAALGVSAGDEVVTTPLTFVASANAAVYLNARPVFADVGEDRCLDARSVAASITTATRAVVAVDYGGLPADAPALRRSASGAPLVVDAAHSLGGFFAGRPVGSLGDVTTLSFHPVKHITTGEGGACLTDDPAVAGSIRRLRNHGMTSAASSRETANWRYDVVELGNNYRMTDFQAALGRSQLRHLDSRVERRAELAARYDRELHGVPGLRLPPRPVDRESAWHIYPVEVDAEQFGWTRDEVIDGLRAEGIQATLHYPAVNSLSLYRGMGYAEGVAPRAEMLSKSLVTLPLFPAMTETDQDDVVEALTRLSSWRR
jgi:dTDP-4-amino-4,6-dideoxygalactose transaminase